MTCTMRKYGCYKTSLICPNICTFLFSIRFVTVDMIEILLRDFIISCGDSQYIAFAYFAQNYQLLK